MEQTTKTKLKRIAKLSDIKVLNDDAKNLIIQTEKDFYGKSCLLDTEKTNILINGYTGKPTKQHFNSSLRYAIARVLSVLGYAKTPTGKTKTLIEDIKRVQYNTEKNQIGFIFSDKTQHL